MAMGKRRRRGRQPSMWVSSSDLPRSAGHPFYERLNRVLDEAGVDGFVEAQCAPFYADGVGRPSLAPGRYFRLLLLGYFEGRDSERAIAWRAADSLSLRAFLDVALQEAPPDHSTLSRTLRRIDVETHQAVFTWVLKRLADAGLVSGKTVGIDATTLEANAALRSIVRRDSGESYETFLHGLAAASGIPTPTRAELARLDRKRPKKGSNDDWTHPHDPDAKITKMKDGRAHLAHKAEQAVDLETGAVVGVTVQDAAAGDTETMVETMVTAAEQLDAVLPAGADLSEVVGDKGYHSDQTLVTPWRTSGCAAMYRSRRAGGGSGRRATRCMPIGGGFGARAGGDCCAVAANISNAPTRISTKPGGCAGCIARACQRAQAAPGARLRLESGPSDAASDRRRHAAQPPGPRPHLRRRPDPRTGPPLAAPAAPLGGRDFPFAQSAARHSLDTVSSNRVTGTRKTTSATGC